ncbi:hypothetical protein BCV69DRAFT_301793 [Microstroma glucosiphilum]|uniref:GATA-type domain-containing protein n=1 Tax=Pseudomicrostroma glucosiphilum TaxID=1684307 RepID=A0A316TWF0_9BASI|nr:hypothetical protein BCV69DRAFT_301793 [Pseudomicrostroma glucosiphilum]PWN17769.1 hypothetical protein BCV69DRAFT_301793 [Pseudomicrostroma glucosiphilum]
MDPNANQGWASAGAYPSGAQAAPSTLQGLMGSHGSNRHQQQQQPHQPPARASSSSLSHLQQQNTDPQPPVEQHDFDSISAADLDALLKQYTSAGPGGVSALDDMVSPSVNQHQRPSGGNSGLANDNSSYSIGNVDGMPFGASFQSAQSYDGRQAELTPRTQNRVLFQDEAKRHDGRAQAESSGSGSGSTALLASGLTNLDWDKIGIPEALRDSPLPSGPRSQAQQRGYTNPSDAEMMVMTSMPGIPHRISHSELSSAGATAGGGSSVGGSVSGNGSGRFGGRNSWDGTSGSPMTYSKSHIGQPSLASNMAMQQADIPPSESDASDASVGSTKRRRMTFSGGDSMHEGGRGRPGGHQNKGWPEQTDLPLEQGQGQQQQSYGAGQPLGSTLSSSAVYDPTMAATSPTFANASHHHGSVRNLDYGGYGGGPSHYTRAEPSGNNIVNSKDLEAMATESLQRASAQNQRTTDGAGHLTAMPAGGSNVMPYPQQHAQSFGHNHQSQPYSQPMPHNSPSRHHNQHAQPQLVRQRSTTAHAALPHRHDASGPGTDYAQGVTILGTGGAAPSHSTSGDARGHTMPSAASLNAQGGNAASHPPGLGSSILKGQDPASSGHAAANDFTRRKGWSNRVVDELLDFAHVLDLTGKILYATTAVQTLTGWKVEELIGTNIFQIVHPQDAPLLKRELNRALQKEGEEIVLYYRLKRNPPKTVRAAKNRRGVEAGDMNTSKETSAAGSGSSAVSSPTESSLPTDSSGIDGAAKKVKDNPAAVGEVDPDAEWITLEMTGHAYFPPLSVGQETNAPSGGEADGEEESDDGSDGETLDGTKLKQENGDEPAPASKAVKEDSVGPMSRDHKRRHSKASLPFGSPQTKTYKLPLARSTEAQCFFCSCRAYPSKSVTVLDSFLELKLENEKLRLQLEELNLTEAAAGDGGRGDHNRDDASATPMGFSTESGVFEAFGISPPMEASPDLRGADEAGSHRSPSASLLSGFDRGGPSGSSSATARTHTHPPASPHGAGELSSPSKGGASGSASREGGPDPRPPYYRSGSAIDASGEHGSSGAPGSYRNKKSKSTMPSSASSITAIRGTPVQESSSGGGGGSAGGSSLLSSAAATGDEDRVCTDCGRTDSPEWRRGPLGPKTLCNACGLRYAKKVKRRSQPSLQINPSTEVGPDGEPSYAADERGSRIVMSPTSASSATPHHHPHQLHGQAQNQVAFGNTSVGMANAGRGPPAQQQQQQQAQNFYPTMGSYNPAGMLVDDGSGYGGAGSGVGVAQMGAGSPLDMSTGMGMGMSSAGYGGQMMSSTSSSAAAAGAGAMPPPPPQQQQQQQQQQMQQQQHIVHQQQQVVQQQQQHLAQQQLQMQQQQQQLQQQFQQQQQQQQQRQMYGHGPGM